MNVSGSNWPTEGSMSTASNESSVLHPIFDSALSDGALSPPADFDMDICMSGFREETTYTDSGAPRTSDSGRTLTKNNSQRPNVPSSTSITTNALSHPASLSTPPKSLRTRDHVHANASAPTPVPPSPVSQTSSAPPSIPSPRLDSQSVLACTQIISNLENYILADLKPLDLILGIIKQTVGSLTDLVHLQQATHNFRCISLFSVVMYQIIELFEAGCGPFLHEGREDDSRRLPAPTNLAIPQCSIGSGLGFGAFEVQAEEQRSWRAHIVVKELRQCVELLRKVVALARSKAVEMAPSLVDSVPGCYQNVDHRLHGLIARMEESQAARV